MNVPEAGCAYFGEAEAATREDSMVRSDKTLEIQGLLTPRAETVTRKTLSTLTPGQVLTIITRDVAAREKLLSLCESFGCVMIDKKEERGTICVQIQR